MASEHKVKIECDLTSAQSHSVSKVTLFSGSNEVEILYRENDGGQPAQRRGNGRDFIGHGSSPCLRE